MIWTYFKSDILVVLEKVLGKCGKSNNWLPVETDSLDG